MSIDYVLKIVFNSLTHSLLSIMIINVVINKLINDG